MPVTNKTVREIRTLRANGKSFQVISRILGLSRLTCWRWATDENQQKLAKYKRDYLDRKRHPLMFTRTIPEGPGGWPKTCFIFRRPNEDSPIFTFHRTAAHKKWAGHGQYFTKLARVKEWAKAQKEFQDE